MSRSLIKSCYIKGTEECLSKEKREGEAFKHLLLSLLLEQEQLPLLNTGRKGYYWNGIQDAVCL